MLRPATPLTILLFIAFILLLISVISTPIVKGIPLATYEGVDFGVFGFCRAGKCSGIKVGYNTDTEESSNSQSGRGPLLPSSSRSSLSSILIVHPVAAFLTLICFMLAASSHLHAPSHSPRYLLVLLILLLPTLLITLLAFLVDILLFVPPHLAWGGWIVLGSTILITASGVVTCAMRRTLVSRKARKKRIAGSAEMIVENFYDGPNPTRLQSPPPLSRQPTMPMVDGAPGADQLPVFSLYDAKGSKETDDERIPLNTRTPSNRTVLSNGIRGDVSEDGSERYGGAGRGGPGGLRGGLGGPHNVLRDELGNPLPQSNAFGPVPSPGQPPRDPVDPRMRREYSNDTMHSQGSRGRGRGGYQPRGFGRGWPYGPGRGGGMNGTGSRGMPLGSMNGDMGRGRQEGPPPDYENGYPPQERGMPGQNNMSDMPSELGPAPYARDPLDAAYGRKPSPCPPSAPGMFARHPSPGPPSAPGGYGRQPSPGPPSSPGGYGRHPSTGPPLAPGGYGRRPSPGPLSAPGGYGRRPSPGPPSAPGGYGRRPSPGPPSAPGGYGRQPSPGPPSAPGGYGRQSSPGPPSAPGFYAYGGRGPSPGPPGAPSSRAESAPPPLPHQESIVIGQAVEMDAFTGSPSRSPVPRRQPQLRDGGYDAQAIGRQPQHNKDSPMSLTSVHSAQVAYVPPRAAWAAGAVRSGTPPQNTPHPLSTIRASPVELPVQSLFRSPSTQPSSPSHNSKKSADYYYEDVDPRFANPEPPPAIPTSLIPGGNKPNTIAHQPPNRNGSPAHFKASTLYESTPEHSRRPSYASKVPSASQHGVNSNERPPPGSQGMGVGGIPDWSPVQSQQRDTLFQANPGSELPGAGSEGTLMAPRGVGQLDPPPN